jgi:glycosyltransferase involved in cell wall biosynthesis
LRIAYLITRADAVGGASIHVRDLARALREKGHQTAVFPGGSAGPVNELLRSAGIEYREVPMLGRALDPIRDFQAYFEIKRALLEWQPDLISAHTSKAGWLGRAAAKSLGIPAIYTPHGWTITDRLGRSQGAVYTIAERMAAPWASAIVCVSEYERTLALEKRVGRPEQLHVIYNGVRDIPPELRAKPEREPVRLISVARLEAPKDHATLLEALGTLREFEWELELVGDGPFAGRIREQTVRLGLGERVRFAGYLPDPAPLLAQAHVFVLSSLSEGFPRTILGAMRAGLPVVASDVGGIREAVEDGVSGILVRRGNPAEMAGALRTLLESPKERQRMGRSGHQIYGRRFRFEYMLDATAALYAKVLENALSPPSQ